VIIYLTAEQVLFLHSRLISDTGGMHGVRDLSMLLSALGRPQASYDGVDLYPDIFKKAAALMDSLVRNHPFVDGNKRTAISAAGIFLLQNGYTFKVGNQEMVNFTLACAQSMKSLEQISAWFKEHTSEKPV
jgi:death on curing protein